MPAIISGTIFNDVNSNGIYNPGTDTGIANAYIALENVTAGTCVNVQSDGTGSYSFTNITTAGVYNLYETVTTPNACPPTLFTQPTGSNDSTTSRRRSITVSAGQISGNTNISGNNFGHDNVTPFGCQSYAWIVAVPSGLTGSRLYKVDLATGSNENKGIVSPVVAVNAIGYNSTDGNIYGWNTTLSGIVRVTPDRNVLTFSSVPNLPNSNYNVGDVDANGYLYIYFQNSANFYVIDVNPNRETFMNLVDPANGYQLQSSGPFGVAIGTALALSDWAFNPLDGFIYTLTTTDGIVRRIDPVTGAVTPLTTTPAVAGPSGYGSQFFDNYNNLYALDNSNGRIYRYPLTPTTATRILFSLSVASTGNDGARCPIAPINFAQISSSKSATPYVGIGQTITYTILVNNTGNSIANNFILIDTIPSGTSFISNIVTIDGTTIAGNPNPPSGINLGNIAIGLHTITFTVITTTIPIPNPIPNVASGSFTFIDGSPPNTITTEFITNVASTTVNYAILTPVKSVDKAYATVGDTLTYTVSIENTGNTTALNLLFIDTIPTGTTFISGTLKQDGINVAGNSNFPGATLPNSVLMGAITTVTFSVKVNSTIPTPNPILNNALLIFSNIVNPIIPTTINTSVASNTAETHISLADFSGFIKQVDKIFATCGDILTYTILMPNSGNITAFNLVFNDTIPSGTAFVTNSVTINGIPQPGFDPAVGFTVPNIPPSTSTTVTFSVQVVCL
ncbi:MAG: DUF6923 family protein [Clostridium sp.]